MGSYSYDASANTLSTHELDAGDVLLPCDGHERHAQLRQHDAGPYGPALDNVVVTETVPTKDDCKHGGWRTMIDGAGNHFKNQGDCVSYFATKGKNPGALPPATSPVKHGNAHHDKATDKHGNAHHDKATDKHGKAHHDKATDKHGAKGHDAKDKKSHQADPANGSHSKHSK